MTKLGKLVVFSIICAISAVVFIGYYFVIRQQEDVVPAVAYYVPVQVLGEYQVNQELLVYEEETIVLLCDNSGLSYCLETGKIMLPDGVAVVSIERDYIYQVHTITLRGAYMQRGSHLLRAHCPLVMAIVLRGNVITVYTQHAAIVNYSNEYMQFVNLRDVYHTIVLIDPGHGGLDSGAVNVLGRNYPQEADIVLAISQKLLYIFDEPGILLIPTRTVDKHVPLATRITMANRLADYFISIHINADGDSRQSRGTLTLYGSAEGSREFAYTLQNALVYALDSHNRGISDTPAVMILRESNVPVALLELLFLSNPAEAARMIDPDTQLLIANVLADVIRSL